MGSVSGREKRFDESFQAWVVWYIFLPHRLICSIISSCSGNEPALYPEKTGRTRGAAESSLSDWLPKGSQDLHRVKFPDVKEGKPSETTIRRKLYYHCAWFSYHYSRQRIFLILGATMTVWALYKTLPLLVEYKTHSAVLYFCFSWVKHANLYSLHTKSL